MHQDFIIFSLPNENNFYLLVNQKFGNQKIEFLTFDNLQKITFQNNIVEQISLEKFFFNNLKFNFFSKTIVLNFSEYCNIVNNCIYKIYNNIFEKIVISRVKKFDYSNFDINISLRNLRIKFPTTLVYFFVKNQIIWIGATPELLGKISDCTFETISLAGTVFKNCSFSLKEKNEHKIVTNFIKNILKIYAYSIIEMHSNLDYIYNDLKHIVTIFRLLINPLKYEELINVLYPTPAICGIPQKMTFNFIKEIEPHNREFYSGKIIINLLFSKMVFVNLRCAKILQGYFEVFVGSGITVDSVVQSEWNETENKINSFVSNLFYF